MLPLAVQLLTLHKYGDWPNNEYKFNTPVKQYMSTVFVYGGGGQDCVSQVWLPVFDIGKCNRFTREFKITEVFFFFFFFLPFYNLTSMVD